MNIDKPAGMTSHDVVALGSATRLIEFIQEDTVKRYHATVRLGATTTTDDAEGDVIASEPAPKLEDAAIEQVLGQFRGAIMQVPPMYSALHHQGRRLHELARAGIVIELPPRPVTIEQIVLLEWQLPLLILDIICSKGTYIRSLARDIGMAIGCGGHLQALRRTAVGQFTIESATPLSAIEAHDFDLMSILLPAEQAVADWPVANIGAEAARQVRNGLPIVLAEIAGARVRAHGPDGALLALLSRVGDSWKPDKVFDWT